MNVDTPGNLKKEIDPLQLGLQVIGSHSTSVLEIQLGILCKASMAVFTHGAISRALPFFFFPYMLHFPFFSLDYRLVHTNASFSSRILVIKSASSLKNEVSKAEVY